MAVELGGLRRSIRRFSLETSFVRAPLNFQKFEDDLYKVAGNDFSRRGGWSVCGRSRRIRRNEKGLGGKKTFELYRPHSKPPRFPDKPRPRKHPRRGPIFPYRFTALTPCFRVGGWLSAGRDTRGHDPPAPVPTRSRWSPSRRRTSPGRARAHDGLRRKTGNPEAAGTALPRVVLCSGDTGLRLAQDPTTLEVWLPGQGAYRGDFRASRNCGDFQARRMRGRAYRPTRGQGHPITSTTAQRLRAGRSAAPSSPSWRTIKRQDGSISVPEVLRPYMGGLEACRRQVNFRLKSHSVTLYAQGPTSSNS